MTDLAFLISQGIPFTNLNDMWMIYWDSLAIAGNNFNDRQYAWLGSLGYVGSLPDRLSQWRHDIATDPSIPTDALQLLWSNIANLFTGGGNTVNDFEGVLVNGGADNTAFSGMRLATTAADGALLGDDFFDESTPESQGVGVITLTPNGFNALGFTDPTGSEVRPKVTFNCITGKRYRLILTPTINSGSCGDVRLYDGDKYIIGNESDTPVGDVDITFVAGNAASPWYSLNGLAYSFDIDFVATIQEVIPQFLPTDDTAQPNHPAGESYIPAFIPDRQDSTAYAVGDEVHWGMYYFQCTTAGTSDVAAPPVDDTVNDGTVVWSRLGRYQDKIGYLSEEARTNKLLWSNDFSNAIWTDDNVAVTGGFSDPAGGISASKLEAILDADTNLNQKQIVSSTNVCGSCYVKKGSGADEACRFNLYDYGGSSDIYTGSFNFDTGVLTTSVGTGYVEELTDGWFRIVMLSDSATNGDYVGLYVGYVGASEGAGEYLYAWGAQLEEGSFPTSYIPTEAATVTRPATVLEFPSEGVLRGNDIAIQGVVVPLADPELDVSNMGMSCYESDDAYLRIVTYNTVRFGYNVGGVSYEVNSAYVPKQGTPFQYQVYKSSSYGFGVRVREWDGLAWGSWTSFVSNADTVDLEIVGNVFIGSFGTTGQFNGNLPVFQTKFTDDPKAWLEQNPIYGEGVPVNAVTYNGELVTNGGEIITYTP